MRKKSNSFSLKVWGARGSIPAPGPLTSYFGGNTSCLEIHCGKETIILDAGTGIRELGEQLNQSRISASILFTHYHWDHIMGLPFFVPGYQPRNHFRIYGESKQGISLRTILSGQMAFPYFPVSLEQMLSQMEFIEIGPAQEFFIGDVQVNTFRSNHPDGCLCYRLKFQDRAITYATDTEHFSETDRNLLKAARDADILIYDSQYTNTEYSHKVGWGHSTWEQGVKLAREAQSKLLILWHHDPSRSDKQIKEIETKARELFKNCYAAYEGMEFSL